MENFVQASKYEAETISIIVSFADLLPSGHTITGTPTILVDVATGYDPNPSAIVYGGITITLGTTVEQRFRLGIPGTIYHIVYSITSSAGEVFDKECYLAILPDEDNAVPTWLPLWEASLLYPYEINDNIQSSASFTNHGWFWTQPLDSWQSSSYFTNTGQIQTVLVVYNHPNDDDLQSQAYFVSGVMNPVSTLSYTDSGDDNYTSNAVFISGTILTVLVSYNTYPEDFMQSSAYFTTGTLV